MRAMVQILAWDAKVPPDPDAAGTTRPGVGSGGRSRSRTGGGDGAGGDQMLGNVPPSGSTMRHRNERA